MARIHAGNKGWLPLHGTRGGTEATYKVSKDGYTTVTGSVTMDSDKEVLVTLLTS